MANTSGFDVVAEVSDVVLNEMLKAAWDNGGTDAEGAIPHEVTVDPSLTIGPYGIEDGQVSIPKEGLSLVMAPPSNGVTVKMATGMQINLDPEDLPVPSLCHFDLSADILITAPFGLIPGSSVNLAVIFSALPRNQVSVTITSGDPIGPLQLPMILEYLHKQYQEGIIPHAETMTGVSYLGFIFDAFLQTFDDESNAARQITATMPDSTHVTVNIPVYLRLSNFNNPLVLSPLGVNANVVISASYQHPAGLIICDLENAAVSVENILPAAGVEGTNYTLDLAGSAGMFDLNELIKTQITSRINTMLDTIKEIRVEVPTVTQIETLAGDKVHEELLNRKYFGVWTPETPEGSPVSISSVVPKALSNALAIGINPTAQADVNGLANFIPAGQDFAIGLDDALVESIIHDIVYGEDFGGIPKTFNNIEGHKCILNSLNWDCQSGKIHFSGNVTVVDAICKSDITVDFWADVGLRWVPGPSGGQVLQPYIIDKDADMPDWAWILAVLGFIFGIILGVVAIVIVAIAESIVEKVGGGVMEDEVSGQLQVIGAWPNVLEGIGSVASTFREQVDIASDGVVFSGSILVTATYALTMVSGADAGGPYIAQAQQNIMLSAGTSHPVLDFNWQLSDGTLGSGNAMSHKFIDNGLYVARLKVKVTEAGGALTHNSVLLRVKNVPPLVHAGGDIEVFEGEIINLKGTFTDKEWVDTHEATWFFGDDTLPEEGQVTETNTAPMAKGSVTGSHAWCNNGNYKVTLQVRDKDGGVSEDSMMVKVKNMPPVLKTKKVFFAYPSVPVTLTASFTDPGWCDTHKGYWDFGDCGPAIPATIKELHEPPEGIGIIAATHVYRNCGRYLARCAVTDSDGATDTATMIVEVVDLLNKGFEDGFRHLIQGLVANEWEPWVMMKQAKVATYTSSTNGSHAKFMANEFVVHGGQRSQNIILNKNTRAGLSQRIYTNVGWDYQVTVWYHLAEELNGKCRLGLDPDGGLDPGSDTILWSEGNEHHDWSLLTARITAKRLQMTVFLEASTEDAKASAFFDDVMLIPYPCPLEDPVREDNSPRPSRKCVNWTDEQKERNVGSNYTKEGFIFDSTRKAEMVIIPANDHRNSGMLRIQESGVRVKLPYAVETVNAVIACERSSRCYMEVYDKQGELLGTVTSSGGSETEELKCIIQGIEYLHFKGLKSDMHIIEICIAKGKRGFQASTDDEPGSLTHRIINRKCSDSN